MKKAPALYQRSQINIKDWLEEEDDFLLGKVPKDLEEIWEEE